MLFILLHNLFRVRVELKDLFIGASGEKDVLFIFSWMEFYTKRGPAISKRSDDFACLCVPQVYQLVKPCGKELSAIVCKTDISNGLLVSFVRANTLSVS